MHRASFALFQFGVDAFRGAAMVTLLFSDLSIGMMFASVFEDGRIIEEGHHDERIARDGLYAQLYGERQV